MSKILYEHPLNERIRNYLKIEHLFNQMENMVNVPLADTYSAFFNSLFSLLDLLDRNDIKGDLIKELERLEKNLVLWSSAPNVDGDALQETLKQTVALICQLKTKEANWLRLKQDKLLDSIRKRFTFQAGCCCSDLPQLHFWLASGEESIKQDCQRWLEALGQIREATGLILMFIRQKDAFVPVDTPSGFYQDNGDGIRLLRIQIDSDKPFYPTISGNKYRFSIRFAEPCAEAGQKYLSSPVSFELARC